MEIRSLTFFALSLVCWGSPCMADADNHCLLLARLTPDSRRLESGLSPENGTLCPVMFISLRGGVCFSCFGSWSTAFCGDHQFYCFKSSGSRQLLSTMFVQYCKLNKKKNELGKKCYVLMFFFLISLVERMNERMNRSLYLFLRPREVALVIYFNEMFTQYRMLIAKKVLVVFSK